MGQLVAHNGGDARLVQVEGRSRSVSKVPACGQHAAAPARCSVSASINQTVGNNMLMVSASGTAVKLG
jgi:uncharacterized protein YbjQ (UPF0145 family)